MDVGADLFEPGIANPGEVVARIDLVDRPAGIFEGEDHAGGAVQIGTMDDDGAGWLKRGEEIGDLTAGTAVSCLSVDRADGEVVVEGDQGDLAAVLGEPIDHLLSIFEEGDVDGREDFFQAGAHLCDSARVVFEDGGGIGHPSMIPLARPYMRIGGSEW